MTDPDGKVRNLCAEREQWVEDVRDELYHINRLAPGRLLDVGCGLGYFLSGVDHRWERHGVEVSAVAAERAAAYGTIHHGDLSSAQYPAAHFDAVVCYHVIEHMADPVAELREMLRVLKPNGALIVGTPDFDGACARRFGERFRLLNDPTHISLFSEPSLRQLLQDHGVEIDRVERPFFETRHFTIENLQRLQDTSQISPPFWGNVITMYCRKSPRSEGAQRLVVATRCAHRVAVEQSEQLELALQLLHEAPQGGGRLICVGDGAPELVTLFGSVGFEAYCQPELGKVLERLGPFDCVVLASLDGFPPQVGERVRRQGARSIAFVGEAAPALDTEAVLRVPALDQTGFELALSFITHAALTQKPSLNIAESAA